MAETDEKWYRPQCETSRTANSTQFENSRQAKISQFVTAKKDSPFGRRLREAFGGASNTEIFKRLKEPLGLKSKSAITTYMRGRVPAATKLVVIAQVANCDLHWLLTGETRPERAVGQPPQNPYGLSEAQLLFVERLADHEGVSFDVMVKELVGVGLDAKARELSLTHSRMSREDLEDVLNAVFSNLPEENDSSNGMGSAKRRV